MADPAKMWGRPARRIDKMRADRLWARYWAIKDEHGNGYYEPILWHLALRGDASAMAALASDFANAAGRIADGWSRAGLSYRAYRLGYALGAQHLAMDGFNRGDMVAYRYWLRRAANAGDPYARDELKRFETRLPHVTAADIGRKRPYRKYD